jgi:CheY-like chemotaxis protein
MSVAHDAVPAAGLGLGGRHGSAAVLAVVPGVLVSWPPRRHTLLRGGAVITVLLVDDQPLIRSGFRALLDIEDDIEVAAEAAGGSQCLALAREHLPDIALIDIQMPVIDGIEATRHIAEDPTLASVHVVILTNYGLDEYVFNAPAW